MKVLGILIQVMKYGAINGYDELANLIMDTCNMIVDKNIVDTYINNSMQYLNIVSNIIFF